MRTNSPPKPRIATLKLLVLFILSGICTEKSLAQQWVQPGAVWFYDYNIYYSPPYPAQIWGTYELYYSGDTLIDSTICQRLTLLRHVYYEEYTTGDTIYNLETVRDYFVKNQEESVYYFQDGEFYLLYAFDADTGDQWIVGYDTTFSTCADTAIVKVSDTGHIWINGSSYKTLSITTSSDSHLGIRGEVNSLCGLTKGIHDIGSFLFPGYQDCGGWATTDWGFMAFRCYRDLINGNWSPNGVPCDLLTGLNNRAMPTEVSISPNPATSVVSIEIPKAYSRDISIEIIDVAGRKHICPSISTFPLKLDVSRLASGLYIVKVASPDDQWVRKFVRR